MVACSTQGVQSGADLAISAAKSTCVSLVHCADEQIGTGMIRPQMALCHCGSPSYAARGGGPYSTRFVRMSSHGYHRAGYIRGRCGCCVLFFYEGTHAPLQKVRMAFVLISSQPVCEEAGKVGAAFSSRNRLPWVASSRNTV